MITTEEFTQAHPVAKKVTWRGIVLAHRVGGLIQTVDWITMQRKLPNGHKSPQWRNMSVEKSPSVITVANDEPGEDVGETLYRVRYVLAESSLLPINQRLVPGKAMTTLVVGTTRRQNVKVLVNEVSLNVCDTFADMNRELVINTRCFQLFIADKKGRFQWDEGYVGPVGPILPKMGECDAAVS